MNFSRFTSSLVLIGLLAVSGAVAQTKPADPSLGQAAASQPAAALVEPLPPYMTSSQIRDMVSTWTPLPPKEAEAELAKLLERLREAEKAVANVEFRVSVRSRWLGDDTDTTQTDYEGQIEGWYYKAVKTTQISRPSASRPAMEVHRLLVGPQFSGRKKVGDAFGTLAESDSEQALYIANARSAVQAENERTIAGLLYRCYFDDNNTIERWIASTSPILKPNVELRRDSKKNRTAVVLTIHPPSAGAFSRIWVIAGQGNPVVTHYASAHQGGEKGISKILHNSDRLETAGGPLSDAVRELQIVTYYDAQQPALPEPRVEVTTINHLARASSPSPEQDFGLQWLNASPGDRFYSNSAKTGELTYLVDEDGGLQLEYASGPSYEALKGLAAEHARQSVWRSRSLIGSAFMVLGVIGLAIFCRVLVARKGVASK